MVIKLLNFFINVLISRRLRAFVGFIAHFSVISRMFGPFSAIEKIILQLLLIIFVIWKLCRTQASGEVLGVRMLEIISCTSILNEKFTVSRSLPGNVWLLLESYSPISLLCCFIFNQSATQRENNRWLQDNLISGWRKGNLWKFHARWSATTWERMWKME